MTNNIKVVIVNSKKDLPEDYGDSYEAVTDTNKRIIYITKNASKGTLEHEKYHILKRHPNKPKSPLNYIRQELEAELHAHDKTSYPRQIKSRLIGWANDIMWRRYKNSPKNAVKIMNSIIEDMSLPDKWIVDWNEIKDRIIKL